MSEPKDVRQPPSQWATTPEETHDASRAERSDLEANGALAQAVNRQAQGQRLPWRELEANVKFRTMFEQAAQFACIAALDGTVVEANRSSIEQCGFARDEVIGKPFWQCGWWSPSRDRRHHTHPGHR